MRLLLAVCIAAAVSTTSSGIASGQEPTGIVAHGDSVSVRFTDADLRAVVQALGRYLDRPLLIGQLPETRVTFETPHPVPRSGVLLLLQGLAASQGLELAEDSAFYRVGTKPPEPPPSTLSAQALAEDSAQLYVIRLKHARAADVAGTIGQLFGLGAGTSGRSLPSGTLNDELRRNIVPPEGAAPSAAAAAGGSGSAVASAALQGRVTIVPDELTNSLLIRATERDYRVITEAVSHLDLRPLQVLIQVLIVEAQKDRQFALGLSAATKNISVDDGDGTVAGSLAGGGGLGDLVLRVMKLGSFDLDATLSAAVSHGDARIVSRPVLLASNNQEAHILVGSQRPFVQVSRSLPTETPTRDQVVQYKSVGTELSVLPTINADGYVSLQIRQEVNNATSEVQFDAPVISTREAETQVLVRDRQTVVLGGLREEQHDVTKSGIPILSDLPIIGGLFGFQERHTTETELFLFITPMIIPDDTVADSAAQRAFDRANRAGVHVTPEEP